METINKNHTISGHAFYWFPDVSSKNSSEETKKNNIYHTLISVSFPGFLYLYIKVYIYKTQSVFTYVCFIYIGFSEKQETRKPGNFWGLIVCYIWLNFGFLRGNFLEGEETVFAVLSFHHLSVVREALDAQKI